MRNIGQFKTVFLQAAFIAAAFIGASSCSNDRKPEDTKDVAEEHNEAKFDNNTNKENDAQFLVNAAENSLESILLGQLAQQNGLLSDVKELGKTMEEGHKNSLNSLAGLANKKVMTIPTAPTDKAKDAYKKISNISGADFDKEYCDRVVNGHKDAIAAFEKASTESKDADIKAWAIATLPGLRTHLDHAITCQKKCEKM